MQMKRFDSKAREKTLARQLDLPRPHSGWLGALASLVDVAPYRKPRSYLEVLQEQNRQRDQETLDRLQATMERLTQHD
jgi:hypothetical protein